MRYPHEFRLPRKLKKIVKRNGRWTEFVYTRFVAEQYPYRPVIKTIREDDRI